MMHVCTVTCMHTPEPAACAGTRCPCRGRSSGAVMPPLGTSSAPSHIAAALRRGVGGGGCEGAEHPQTHRSAESAPRGVPVTPRPFPNPIVTARRRAALSHCPEGEGGGGGAQCGTAKLRRGETEARSPGADGNGAAAASTPSSLPPPPSPLGPRGAVWAPQKHLSHPRHAAAAAARPAELPVARPPSRKAAHEPPRVPLPGRGGGEGGGGRPHSGKGGGGAGPNPPGAEP